MKYLKTTTIALLLSSFCTTNAAFASGLPKLTEQMRKQAYIDRKYEQTKIRAANEARLNAIRLKNEARLAGVKTPIMSEEVPVLDAAPELDMKEREAILSQTIIRNPMPFSSMLPPMIFPSVPTPITANINKEAPENIDMNRLGQAWLSWNNALREELGLAPYTIHESLNFTAQDWSNFSRDRGYITHGRPGDNCMGEKNYTCYNFPAIDKWFQDRGVNPKVISRSKHTENIGLGRFQCSQADCTDEAIAAIKKTYDFFYAEKRYNGVHYRSMVNPNFSKIGIGFSYKNGTYYATIHYATDL